MMDFRKLREEITDNLDLEYFLERESIDYKLTRGASGMQLNIKCCPHPDCGDRRWRVYLNADNGLGNCFKCGETFNKSTYIKAALEIEKWSDFNKAAQDIMREQGWRPKRLIPASVEVGEVKLPYSIELPTAEGENLQYLEDRGITGEYAKFFGLRYCDFGFWKFNDEDGKPQIQKFDNRCIIPVYDLDGTLKTFQGRTLAPPLTEAQKTLGITERKYLFPKMLPGTGRYLYNGNNIVTEKEAALGEGAFDVAAIKIAFDEDVNLRKVAAIGSFGKHLSYGSTTGDDQLGRLKQLQRRGLKKLTIMWDGEHDALIAALDAAKRTTAIGLETHLALLPAGKDPNEVPGDVTRQAYYDAPLWTPTLDVKLRLRNPYRKR